MVIKYLTKSTRAMAQGGAALLFAVLAVVLLFSTVMRWRFESAMRDGVSFTHTGDGDAIPVLLEARSMRPDDPLPSLFLGQAFLDRGLRHTADAAAATPEKGASSEKKDEPPKDDKKDEKKDEPDEPPAANDPYAIAKKALREAVKHFDDAMRKRDEWPVPLSESCVAGAVATRLALADITPTDRAGLIDEASKTLERAKDGDDPDLVALRAGIAIAKGDTAGAQKALGDLSARLGSAGRGAVGSYYWHRGMLGLIARDPASVDDLKRASLFRPVDADSGRLVALALRTFVADPALAPKEPKELEERCIAYEAMLQQNVKGGRSRWGFDKASHAAAWNAVGLGYLRVPNPTKAQGAFQQAISNKTEAIYYVNNALCQKVMAENPPAGANPEQHRNKYLADAASALVDVVGRIFEKEKLRERDKFALDLLLLAAGLYHQSGRHTEGQKPIQVAHDKYGLEDKDFFRTRGALLDWGNRLDLAVVDYKEAIARKHKDSYKMEIRIDKFERSRKR